MTMDSSTEPQVPSRLNMVAGLGPQRRMLYCTDNSAAIYTPPTAAPKRMARVRLPSGVRPPRRFPASAEKESFPSKGRDRSSIPAETADAMK